MVEQMLKYVPTPDEITELERIQDQVCCVILLLFCVSEKTCRYFSPACLLSLRFSLLASSQASNRATPTTHTHTHTRTQQVDMFAAADRYLFEMSRIPHFEARLSSLFYMRKVCCVVSFSLYLLSLSISLSLPVSQSLTAAPY
jgi:hypothetical protein